MSEQVSFFCKRTAISTKPVQPGKFSPLSVLDRVMERNNLRIVLYYHLSTRKKPGEMTKKLVESISEALSAFPAVVGRLLRDHEGKWTIKCNDAGLRVVEVRMKGSLNEWMKNVDREKEMKLVHWEEMYENAYFWSPFYVQITEFEHGGLAIGLSCTHLLSDPPCAAMMIKAWAETTARGKMASPPLFHPLPPRRSFIKNPNHHPNFNLINHYKSTIENSPPSIISHAKQTTITLQFNQEMVKHCMAMAESNQTPFFALAALFWTRISKIKRENGGLIDLSICLDMRKVLGLDNSFFGNCMVYNKVHGDGLDENEVSKAVIAINEVVSGMDRDEVMDLIEWLEKRENRDQDPPRMNGCDLVCVNLEDVDWYTAVFEGNSRPIRVSCYIEPDVGPGQIVILRSRGGDGPLSREVSITLGEDEVEKLLDDEVIKKIGPSVLMGLNKRLC